MRSENDAVIEMTKGGGKDLSWVTRVVRDRVILPRDGAPGDSVIRHVEVCPKRGAFHPALVSDKTGRVLHTSGS